MIFQYTWKQVLSGEKTQTRRLAKAGEFLWEDNGVSKVSQDYPSSRIKWETGKTYAVQPGRGKKSVGRIKLVGIQLQNLRELSLGDAIAEGVCYIPEAWEWLNGDGLGLGPKKMVMAFQHLWNKIHTKTGTRWEDNPTVWVLEFEAII